MATQQHPVRGGTPIDDFDAIAATVQLYIDGSARTASGDRCPSSRSSRSLASMAGGAWSTRPSRTQLERCLRKP